MAARSAIISYELRAAFGRLSHSLTSMSESGISHHFSAPQNLVAIGVIVEHRASRTKHVAASYLVLDAESRGANMLERIGPEISAPVWTGKELAGLAGDPIGHKTHPFARSCGADDQP